MRFGVLGPLEVLGDDGTAVDLGGRQPRLVLAMLLAADGRLVTADAIVDELWGEVPPSTAAGTLQSYMSRLRRKLAPAVQLLWEDPGYKLDVGAAEVDARRFEQLADTGRAHLEAGRAQEAREVLGAAADLWRGPALLEFLDRDFATGVAMRQLGHRPRRRGRGRRGRGRGQGRSPDARHPAGEVERADRADRRGRRRPRGWRFR